MRSLVRRLPHQHGKEAKVRSSVDLLTSWLISGQPRASQNIVRVIEDWLERLEGPEVSRLHWTCRHYPEYQLAFEKSIRGQVLEFFLDYDANTDFLGLFAYLRMTSDLERLHDLVLKINHANLLAPHGHGEVNADEGYVRFRISADIEGLRVSPSFLDFLLQSACGYFERNLTTLVPKPSVVLA